MIELSASSGVLFALLALLAGRSAAVNSSDAGVAQARRLRSADKSHELELAFRAALSGTLRGDLEGEAAEIWLEAQVSGGSDVSYAATAREFEVIEERLRPGFESLPKNKDGRISHQAVTYLVHKYFVQEHRWHIQGLGQDEAGGGAFTFNVTTMDQATIIQKRAPALVEAMQRAREAGIGLTLADATAITATLYKLIVDDTSSLLQDAYRINQLHVEDALESQQLYDLLLSYSIFVFASDRRAGYEINVDSHDYTKMRARSINMSISTWPVAQHMVYSLDAILNQAWAERHTTNPFVSKTFRYSSVLESVLSTSEDFGPKQDASCRGMKEYLIGLDSAGTGRVRYDDFHAAGNVTASFHFSESAETLRKLGALDESGFGVPKVIISNYVLGPSNCYPSSTYRTFCCLSECEDLMSRIEKVVRAPSALPDQLLELVAELQTTNISSSSDVSQGLAKSLVEKLHAIAVHHGGEVPLHGRLFAQWLHFAFPLECPYPHAAASASYTPSQWLQAGMSKLASSGSSKDGTEELMSGWSDEEFLPLAQTAQRRSVSLRRAFGIFMQLAMFCAALRVVAQLVGRQRVLLHGQWSDKDIKDTV